MRSGCGPTGGDDCAIRTVLDCFVPKDYSATWYSTFRRGRVHSGLVIVLVAIPLAPQFLLWDGDVHHECTKEFLAIEPVGGAIGPCDVALVVEEFHEYEGFDWRTARLKTMQLM